jgi:hypothetical protein
VVCASLTQNQNSHHTHQTAHKKRAATDEQQKGRRNKSSRGPRARHDCCNFFENVIANICTTFAFVYVSSNPKMISAEDYSYLFVLLYLLPFFSYRIIHPTHLYVSTSSKVCLFDSLHTGGHALWSQATTTEMLSAVPRRRLTMDNRK